MKKRWPSKDANKKFLKDRIFSQMYESSGFSRFWSYSMTWIIVMLKGILDELCQSDDIMGYRPYHYAAERLSGD